MSEPPPFPMALRGWLQRRRPGKARSGGGCLIRNNEPTVRVLDRKVAGYPINQVF
jgi:hypothetical protein